MSAIFFPFPIDKPFFFLGTGKFRGTYFSWIPIFGQEQNHKNKESGFVKEPGLYQFTKQQVNRNWEFEQFNRVDWTVFVREWYFWTEKFRKQLKVADHWFGQKPD